MNNIQNKVFGALQRQGYFVLLASIILVGLNIGFSFFIRKTELFYIPNVYPLGLPLPTIFTALIVLFVTWGIYQFRYVQNYPIASLLILSGGWTNLFEKLLYQNVADYISFVFSYINLADIQLWTGLVILNLQIWLWTKPNRHDQNSDDT